MYCPPVCGIMEANSALLKVPSKETIPATTQTARTNSGEPTCAAMTPGLRKIPEPMPPPATSIVALNSPSAGMSLGWVEGDGAGASLMVQEGSNQATL